MPSMHSGFRHIPAWAPFLLLIQRLSALWVYAPNGLSLLIVSSMRVVRWRNAAGALHVLGLCQMNLSQTVRSLHSRKSHP